MSITSGKIAAQPEPMHEAALERGFEALSTLAILLKIDGERVTAHTRLSQPMLTALFQRVTHMGSSGQGQVAKLCNQMIVAAAMSIIAESIQVAKQSGLDARAIRSTPV